MFVCLYNEGYVDAFAAGADLDFDLSPPFDAAVNEAPTARPSRRNIHVATGLNRPSMACSPHLRHSVHGDPKRGKETQIRHFAQRKKTKPQNPP